MRWLCHRLRHGLRHGLSARLAAGGDNGADDGNAIVEFVFVAVSVLVPLIYLVVSVASVQRSSLAVTQAAREAGRAYATAETVEQGSARADVAVRIALADQGLEANGVDVRVVTAGSTCDGPLTSPSLAPGGEYAVCVSRRSALPGIPSIVEGRGITTVGRFEVHVDDFRASG